jgi:hypothetical protein
MADDGRQHIPTTEARGGETPGITRYVLGVSLAAVIILFAIVLLIWR